MDTTKNPHKGGQDAFRAHHSTTSPTVSPDFEQAATRWQAPSPYQCLALLQDRMTAAGMPYTGKHPLKTDGTINRWDANGRRNGPLWCFIHELSSGHLAAAFGDWRTASSHHFTSWENGHAVDPNEAQHLRDELERRRQWAEEQETKSKAQTAKRSQEQWAYLPEAGSSAYLEAKQVQAFGLRYGADYHGRFIAVPMRDISGTLRAFQRIYEDGHKRFPKGSEKKGCYHLISQLDPAGELYLAEGYATAVSVYQATGKPVAVCFDAGNLRAVADALQAVYPELRLIVAADNDQWKAEETGPEGKPKGNAGIKAAYAVAHAHPGTRVAIPRFDNLDTSDKPTDFNDLARLAGVEHVARQLEKAKEPRQGNGEDTAPSVQAPTADRAYSLQFAVAGQQPQSKVAAILTRHNTGLAYDHITQKWMMWGNTQWREITYTAAFRTVQQWIDAGLTDNEGYTASFVNGVIAFLKAMLATDSFDEDPRLVPFQNGVLDLSSMKLMPHSPTLKISWCLPFDYDPAATCEPVIAWLRECVAGDPLQVELLRAYIKAVITGRSDLQRYLELIGPGGTGKGEFIRLCSNLVGKRNVHVTALKHLEENRFETARLYRKRLCVITDAEKYSGDVSMLKAMTGQDDLRFEEKHKQAGESFKFQGMVLIGANQEITSSDYTSGMQRRRITMRFDNQVDPAQRRDLEHEFEPYLPGVLAWALAMEDTRMKELLVETDSHVPTVGGFNLQTLKKVNPLAAWADECLILDHIAETPVGSLTERTRIERIGDFTSESETIIGHADDWLYPNYVKWCRGKGNKASSSVNFTGLLKDLLCHQLKLEGIEKLDRAGAKLSRFKGIRLRTDSDQHLGNLLFGTRQVRVRYGLGTGCIEQSTGSTDKSKFPRSDVNAVFDDCAVEPLAHSTNAYGKSLGKNSTDLVQPVPPVLHEQKQGLAKDPPVLNPYQPVPEALRPVPEALESPPDPGPGYLDALVESFQRDITPDLEPGPKLSPAYAAADEPVSCTQHCNDCCNLDPCKAGCRLRFGVIPMEQRATPPCNGTDFELKEGRA